MLSRLRLEAFGRTAADVEATLYPHADLIEKMLGVDVSRGVAVIERSVEEPDGSIFAWRGRLILHPDTSGAFDPSGPPPSEATLRRIAPSPEPEPAHA